MTLIEPVLEYKNQFKRQAELQKNKPSKPFRYKIHNKKFEEIQLNKYYDLVLSIHSWYGIGFDIELMNKFLTSIAPNGAGLIQLATTQGFSHQLAKLNPALNLDINAKALSEWCHDHKLNHQYTESMIHIPRHTFIGPKNYLTPQAKCFASFLLGGPWDKLPHKITDCATKIFHTQNKDFSFPSGNLEFTAPTKH